MMDLIDWELLGIIAEFFGRTICVILFVLAGVTKNTHHMIMYGFFMLLFAIRDVKR